jgi:hypothetical protein
VGWGDFVFYGIPIVDSGRWNGWPGSAEELELAEGAFIFPGEAGLLAVEILERAVFVTELAEGEGGGAAVGERLLGMELFVVHAAGEDLGFDPPGALDSPLGGSHAVDEVTLGEVDGLEASEVGVEVFLPDGGVFPGKEDGLGGEAVFEGVLRRARLTGSGFGAGL